MDTTCCYQKELLLKISITAPAKHVSPNCSDEADAVAVDCYSAGTNGSNEIYSQQKRPSLQVNNIYREKKKKP